MRFSLVALLAIASPAIAQPPPPLVAPTDAQSPADEKKGFTVPAGFEVQLVASEPEIQKPMQMAWDAKGRLWVTTSYHYPFAAPQGKGTDKLYILSDFDTETGKARKIQVFANDLNIPIGILPLPDCKSCIVSSTGEIRKYTDTDDDGKADKMEVLFTGFGYRDTHGMYNSFTLMPDGWVYACHGYLNTSKVKGKDGHEVEMNSGNTFRFRPDGSRIEVYTRGQVNPFGIAVDPWFNLYTADCHSKPITQLIPGAYYDSFGKPHDGLGFGPHVTRHDHGSTGLCGLAWYDADQFPKDYLGCMFVGNVVTSRINFDKIEWKGATPVAKELPDFLTSKDLWFRPVDIKLGPDGALYVADFYNKIIGHYEVDLKHPGRDHDHGRLWRIVWKGDGAKSAKAHRADFTKVTDTDLFEDLFHPNLTVRFLAGHQLRQRVADGKKVLIRGDAIGRLTEPSNQTIPAKGWMIAIGGDSANTNVDEQKSNLMTEKLWQQSHPDLVTGHNVRSLTNRANWEADERGLVLDVLKTFESPHQRRAVAEAMIFHPHADFVAPLVELIKKTPAEDTHLVLAARIALRNCLRDAERAWPSAGAKHDPIYTEIALAIPSKKAAEYLLDQLKHSHISPERLPPTAEHIARNGDATDWGSTLGWLTGTDFSPAIGEAVLGVFRGVQAQGKRLDKSQTDWILVAVDRELGRNVPVNQLTQTENVKRLLSVIRVLGAVPGIVEKWDNSNIRPGTVKSLVELVKTATMPPDLRASSADALLRIDTKSAIPILRSLLAEAAISRDFHDRLLIVFASSNNREARLDARDALKDAPYRTAVAVGTALAGTAVGADDLLGAIKQGKAPARLLQEKAILERLRAAKVPDLDKQIGELTKGLPPLDQKIAEVIKKRTTAFASARPNKELGAKLFTQHCAACHKIGDAGGKIAPNLDGIGIRGLERILEDVLDPNRNVDQAFRARIITTKDERTITGLMLRVEGEVLVIADDQGKEVRIPTKDIDKNRETMLSPMPANFAEAIPEADFQHLLAYLLDQRAKEMKK